MSFQIPDNASFDRLVEYSTGVIASLEAIEETRSLSPKWLELRTKITDMRSEWEKANWNLIGASARVHVCDSRWDDQVVEISGRAWLAAHKDAKIEPYKSLFGTIKANDLIRMGPHKATVWGHKLLAKGRELKHPELDSLLSSFETTTAELQKAFIDRMECSEQLAMFSVRKNKMINEIEALIANTEIDVLQIFPGSRRTVRAMISWNTHMGRNSNKKLDADLQDYVAYSSNGDHEIIPD